MSAQPQLDRLKSQLLTSGLQVKDPTLFQVINQLIDFVRQLQSALNADISGNSGAIVNISDLDFLTHTNEAIALPNSRQLVAGTGVTFDDTLVNERIVNVVPASQWSVLTDGDLIEPELIYAGGDVIMTHIP